MNSATNLHEQQNFPQTTYSKERSPDDADFKLAGPLLNFQVRTFWLFQAAKFM